ncbi:MAG: efflux RND transporter periplasmic adaptor subunit [Bacteroidales bacterium]|jgi:HlyD family secretion protein|nr:efflux RND transporter periplasmic adaptor subunit [Bacteroidales bacterium]
MKSKKLLIILGVVLVVLLVFFGIGKKAGWFGQEGYLKVAVKVGETRDITEMITANGKIQPETEVKISPDVSGEIVELAIKEGDNVTKDQFLLKIKPENYIMIRNRTEASLINSKARGKQAEAQLQMRKLDFNRTKQLFEDKAVSESEFELSETNYYTAKAEKEAAEFSVMSAEAALEEAQENLEKTSIYAPMSGTISALNVELGERVVGTELMSGTEILRLADLSMMEVEVEVNENDIVRVAYMDTAIIEVDAYLDTKFKGVVTEIPVSANVTGISTDQVTNFNVKIRLLAESYQDKVSESNPYPLRPGMSATADIQTEVKKGIYCIPIQAVTTRIPSQENEEDSDREEEVESASISSSGEVDVTYADKTSPGDEEKQTVVFVEIDGKAVMKVVKTGIQDNTYIEILEGLDPEDNIVIAPYSAISKELKDGMALEIVPEDRLYSED